MTFFWVPGTTQHPAIFYKTELFKKYDGYRTDFRIASDWIRNLNFWCQGVRFKFVEIMVADFNNSGISSARSELKQSEGHRVLRNTSLNTAPGRN